MRIFTSMTSTKISVILKLLYTPLSEDISNYRYYSTGHSENCKTYEWYGAKVQFFIRNLKLNRLGIRDKVYWLCLRLCKKLTVAEIKPVILLHHSNSNFIRYALPSLMRIANKSFSLRSLRSIVLNFLTNRILLLR